MNLLISAACMIFSIFLLTPANCERSDWPQPPKWTEKAVMARYLAHYADWAVMAAISPVFGHQPFGTVQSFCDGPLTNSTGQPFFYTAKISDTWNNINYNNTVSITISQAMTDYCESKNWDPQDPVCSRLTLTGQMIQVPSSQVPFVREALFTRHPRMKSWPKGHGWIFYQLKITGVYLLDYYGGCTIIPVSDYFKASPPMPSKFGQKFYKHVLKQVG